jgi:hypothetical protein
MAQYSTVIGDSVSEFPEHLIQWYHNVAQPGTSFITHLGVPATIAPIISISIIVFCPLYFLGMLLFGPSCLGFTGRARCGLPSIDA